jgi:hypothetical protein
VLHRSLVSHYFGERFRLEKTSLKEVSFGYDSVCECYEQCKHRIAATYKRMIEHTENCYHYSNCTDEAVHLSKYEAESIVEQ